MQTLATRATAAIMAAFALAILAGAASERRAEYLDNESAFYECIESGLSRAECLTVFDQNNSVGRRTGYNTTCHHSTLKEQKK